MKHLLAFLALLLSAVLASAGLPPKPIDYSGTVVAISPTVVYVQGKIGTRVFQIYPGTVFGKGASKKITDFPVGAPVIVVFSEFAGVAKAENIRSPLHDKKTAPKKPAEKKPAPKQ